MPHRLEAAHNLLALLGGDTSKAPALAALLPPAPADERLIGSLPSATAADLRDYVLKFERARKVVPFFEIENALRELGFCIARLPEGDIGR